jgi:hypothetical protein
LAKRIAKAAEVSKNGVHSIDESARAIRSLVGTAGGDGGAGVASSGSADSGR